jgi:hypothetical protein
MSPRTSSLARACPRRDGSGDGSGLPPAGCPVCGAPRPSPRAQYCSPTCRQRAYRCRQATNGTAGPAHTVPDLAQLTRELRRLRHIVAHTIYACPSCDQRLFGERRCNDCNRFCQALGLGGVCPHCDEPVLLTELLDLEAPSV